MKRRGILIGLVGAMGALLTAGMGALAAAFGLGTTRRREAGGQGWTTLCRVDEVDDSEPLARSYTFQRQDGWYQQEVTRQVYVCRVGGEITVFSRRCTHLGCQVRWRGRSSQFACPCHQARFAPDGTVQSGPAPRPLDRVSHRVQGNEVEVELT